MEKGLPAREPVATAIARVLPANPSFVYRLYPLRQLLAEKASPSPATMLCSFGSL